MTDELSELLRKCHRAELLPLAERLGVVPGDLPLGALSQAIAFRLRRVATHELMNVLRRWGAPPSYRDVLVEVGTRLGLSVPADPALAELAIVRHHVMTTWKALPPAEREQRWREAAGAPPIPLEGAQAVAMLERRVEPGVGLFLTRLATEPVLPLPGCLMISWFWRARDDLAVPAILEVARLRQVLRHRVTVGIVGSPSSGKDAAMGALFGMPTGNVNPVAGSTREVEIRQLPGSTALFVVNTPGMGDVMESVTEEARQVLDHIDVYVYLVNAQGGVQARELADHAACRARRRPVLVVVNKIDTLRERDRERFLEDCRTKLGIKSDDVVGCAFDPLPQLSPHPIGVGAVREWLRRELEKLGKDPRELPWVRAAEPAPSPAAL
jgi:GTP-binding protein EngB required for normal cell division